MCSAYTLPRWADWNQNSRFDLTVAIVDHRTLAIDCCVENTGDYAFFDNHAYCDKAPGLSLLAVPAYLLWKAIAALPPVARALQRATASRAFAATLNPIGTGLLPEKIGFAAALSLATFLVVSVPAAALAALLFFFLQTFSASSWQRVAVALSYALATPAFTYGGSFYAHQLVAALLFAAFVLVFQCPRGGIGRPRQLAVGCLLGLAVAAEYPAVLIAGVLVSYGLWRHGGRWLAAGAVGAAGPLVIVAAYHWLIFATPVPVAYRYSALWQQRHSIGFLSLTFPHWDALWGITFSRYRGLFLLSPVLLLSFPGLYALWRRRTHRAEVVVSVAAIVAFFAFNSSSAMWWGGFAIGPRYLVPVLPFLAWPLIGFVERPGQAWRRFVFAGLALISWLSVWGMSWAGQHFPEDTRRFPLREYAWPHLAVGDLARNLGTLVGLSGWWSLLPLAFLTSAIGCGWWIASRRWTETV